MKIRPTNKLLLTTSAFALIVAGAAHAQTAPGAVAEVVVTGSRLANVGFTAPTPVTAIGSALVEQRAPSSIIEVVNQLPQFRNTANPQNINQPGVRTAGQANSDLRGLGVSRTLVLVNGNRHVPTTAAGAVDLNNIPTSLVDRVEVVTGGASAAYGSDAVAGVVNVILKNNLEGFKGQVQYGVSQRGDNIEPLLAVGWGTRFADDRGHFIIGGEYNENHGAGSIWTRDWGRQEPGLVTLPATRAAGLPANIWARNVETSATSINGFINSPGPLKGITFSPNGTPQPFQFGTVVGTTSMISPTQTNYQNNLLPWQQLRGAYDRSASLARVEFEVTPELTVYGTLNYATLHGRTIGNGTSPTDIIILRNNPYIPAGILATMVAGNIPSFNMSILDGLDSKLGPSRVRNRSEEMEATLGAQGKVLDNWNWDVSLVQGRMHSIRSAYGYPKTANYYESLYAVPGPNGTVVCGPPATNPYFLSKDATTRAIYLQNLEPGCVPYNPFGYQSVSQAAIDYVQGASFSNEHLKQTVWAANLSGEPLMLPAGPVSFGVGGETRKQTFSAVAGYNSAPLYLVNENNVSYDASVTVWEGYAEVAAPLLKDLFLVKSLGVNAAVRHTDYSTSGGVNTWKIGATWDVTDAVRFRATRSRDIRAPNITELFSKGTQGRGNITNPVNGVTAVTSGYSSGNPALEPETANTFTAGIVLQPTFEWARGFRASVDYYHIKIEDVIASIAGQNVVNYCLVNKITEFCSQIDFDAGQAIGFTATRSIPQNLNALETNGVDIEIAYRPPIDLIGLPGSLDIRSLSSWVDDLRSVAPNPAGGAPIDLDTAGAQAGVPEWQSSLNFNYALERLTVNLQAHYESPIKYSTSLVGPDDPTYNPASSISINKNKFPGLVYLSLNAGYELIKQDNRRLQLYGVIDNLLDKDPPVVAMGLNTGSANYDVVGRTFKMGVRFQF